MAEQFDTALIHAVNLARVESGSVKKVVESLEELAKDLQKKIVDAGDDLSPKKLARTKKVLAGAENTISQYYEAIANDMGETLTGVATTEGIQSAKLINSALGIEAFDSLITEKQAEALVDEDVIFGHSSRDWWSAQDERLRFKFRGQITEGVLMGESTDELIRRIRGTKAGGFRDGIMNTSKHEAETLVRSSVQTVSNEARLRNFQENDDVIKGIEWVSTLDSRTTNKCRALDGLQWDLDGNPIGHNKVFPGPTAHWRCRSTQVSVTYGWDELAGKKIGKSEEKYEDAFKSALADKGFDDAAIERAVAGQRAAMGGPVSATKTFEDWLGDQSAEFAEELLGQGRYELWRSGEISLRDLTSQYGRELTVKELRAAVETGTLPTSSEAVASSGLSIANFTAAELKAAEKQLTLEAERAAQEQVELLLTNPPKGKAAMGKMVAWAQQQEGATTAQKTLDIAQQAIEEKNRQTQLKKWLKAKTAGKSPTKGQAATFANLPPDQKAEWQEELDLQLAGKKKILEAADSTDAAEKQIWEEKFGSNPKAPKLGKKKWAEAASEYEAAVEATNSTVQQKALQSQAAKKLAETGEWPESYDEIYELSRLTEKQMDAVAALADDPDAQGDFQELIASWKAKLQKDAAPPPSAPDLTPKTDTPAFGPGANLRTVKPLGGSTGAELIEDRETGKFWVRKRGASAEHLREESTADALYRAAGAKVPASVVREEADGLTKYSEWLDGKSLDEVLAEAGDAAAVRADLQENAVADMLFGNWDVIGAARDNVLVVSGRAIRIDNGGSLRFRAQGARKPAGKFAREVEELETFFDRSINPQTTDIYAGLGKDDIDRQIQALVARRDSILAAVPDDDAELRQILAARLDYLEEQLPRRSRATSHADRELRSRLAADIDPEIGAKIDKTKSNGLDNLMDDDLIEDNSVLIWSETAPDGSIVTKAQLKTTATGSRAVQKKLKDVLDSAQDVDGANTPDTEWETILAAAKTVTLHAHDKGYSITKIEALKKLKRDLLRQTPSGGNAAAKKAHYLAAIDEIEAAMVDSRAPKGLRKFEPKTGSGSAALSQESDWQDVTRSSSWTHKTKEASDGRLRETANVNAEIPVDAGVYSMRRGDAEVRFVPSLNRAGLRHGRALEGTLEVRVTRQPGVESATDIRETLEAIGLPTGRPSPERLEALAIHKTLYLRNKVSKKYLKKFKDENLTDAARLKLARAEHKKQIGPVMLSGEDVIEYPAGGGRARFLRTDYDLVDLGQVRMSATLHHITARGVDETVEAMLRSGGLATSTTGRLRKGVPILREGGWQIGDSPLDDITSGGADYFFTRIRHPLDSSGLTGIFFKPTALRRSDAVSYREDLYGDTGEFDKRVATINDYLRLSKKRDNETNFKGGLSLIDEVQSIQVRSEEARQRVIDAYRAAGYETLPDGRSVESIVKNLNL